MFRRAIGKLDRWRRTKQLIAAEGAPVSWYDETYRGGVAQYGVHYSQSMYLPLWDAMCGRIHDGASILEIGRGPGQLAQMIHDRAVLRDYVGFDFSPVAIELAKKNLPQKRFEVADARTTDLFMTVDYDTVVCTEVLEHIVDDLGVLRCIPKGRRVLATVPNFYFPSHVRFFASADAVRARYGPLFDSLDVTEHHQVDDPDGSRGMWFMLDGRR